MIGLGGETVMVPIPNCRCGSAQIGVHRWIEEFGEDRAGKFYWSYCCSVCGYEVDGDTIEEALVKWTKGK